MKWHQIALICLITCIFSCDDSLNIFWDNEPCTVDYSASSGHTFPMSVDDLDWRDFFVLEASFPSPDKYQISMEYTNYAISVCVNPHTITYQAKCKLNSSFIDGYSDQMYWGMTIDPFYHKCDDLDKKAPYDDATRGFGDKKDLLGFYKTEPNTVVCPSSGCDEEADLKNTFYVTLTFVMTMDRDMYEHFKEKALPELINEIFKEIEFDFSYTR